ncbi:ABC transporter ATP-binding protein [Celeribacter sp. SCSIO 80788]|uniref:ABC transporter ATP-binding protein n=1 Tax=Celeribacter sp. SCSIO 80788 TaxID=3117013 RepID=UPI003DA475D0
MSGADASQPAAIRLAGIDKRFGAVHANRAIDLCVAPGSIHGLLGENGAGKSTLMKILFGMIRADAGTVEIDGAAVAFRSSAEALSTGIGMVQQHFSLIPAFSVVENLIMGRTRGSVLSRLSRRLDLKAAAERAQELSDRFSFGIEPTAKVATLSVGARQKVEILKALWGGARTLVLDEPTAALSPPEAEELYAVLHRLRAEGTTIVLISHKMPEIMHLCDRVTVLRDGAVVGEAELKGKALGDPAVRQPIEAALVTMMIGRDKPALPERAALDGPVILDMRGLTDGSRLGPLDLKVHGGEIVAVVGVEGNGQSELVELLMGLRKARDGMIGIDNHNVVDWPTQRRLNAGLAHISEDRHATGVADSMSLIDNASIGFVDGAPFSGSPLILSQKQRRVFTEVLIERHKVRTPSPDLPMASLSGGNQQKLVVGRELARAPRLMIAAQPTRGLDIGSTVAVQDALLRLRAEGNAVLLLSLDLSEVFAIADRLVVLRKGRIVGEMVAAEFDIDQIGRWMSGAADTTQMERRA